MPIIDQLTDWVPLLNQPYAERLGIQAVWDLKTANGMPVRVERRGQGMNNSLLRVDVGGEAFACKLFVADERQRARREWTALNWVRGAGLDLTPVPVAYLPSGPLPQPAVIYRWVEATPLSQRRLADGDLDRLIVDLGRIHRARPLPDSHPLIAYHQPPDLATYLAEIRTNAGQVSVWAEKPHHPEQPVPTWSADLPFLAPAVAATVRLAEQAIAHTGLSGEYPVAVLARVDGNLDNVLCDEVGRLTFVDWEYSGLGDPAYDLAELRWHPGAVSISAERWDAALASYTPPCGDPDFLQRLALYNRLLPIWWVGRSALYLLEGAGCVPSRPRLSPISEQIYHEVRARLDRLLAFLGLAA